MEDEINDKLEYLDTTKTLIKEAILDKGQSIDDNLPFREYSNKISNIRQYGHSTDANATASDILENKTAYVNDVKITGTMPNNDNLTYTPSDEEQIIPNGYGRILVNPIDITKLNDYNTCLTITDEILNGVPELPYVELEYIESTGTQYIDTQILMNGTTNFEVDYEISSVVYWGAALGTDNKSSAIYYYGISNNNSINSNYLHIGNKETLFSNSIAQLNLLTKAKYTSSNKQLVVTNTKGTLTQNHSYSSISSSQYPIFIFALNRTGTPADISKLKLHHLIISDENGIKGNFIPVKRKSDNEICLYDTVTETFFENAGTGEFIGGSEI